MSNKAIEIPSTNLRKFVTGQYARKHDDFRHYRIALSEKEEKLPFRLYNKAALQYAKDVQYDRFNNQYILIDPEQIVSAFEIRKELLIQAETQLKLPVIGWNRRGKRFIVSSSENYTDQFGVLFEKHEQDYFVAEFEPDDSIILRVTLFPIFHLPEPDHHSMNYVISKMMGSADEDARHAQLASSAVR